MSQPSIAIAANFTAERLRDSLEFWLATLDLPLGITFAPFDQVFQELLDPSSTLSSNTGGVNVVLLKLDEWIGAASRTHGADTVPLPPPQLDRTIDELVSAAQSASARTATPVLLVVCPPTPGAVDVPATRALLERADALLLAGLSGNPGVRVVTADALAALYPVDSYYDEEAHTLGQIPYTELYFAALGTMIARHVHALRVAPHKVVVLDCDNTLWKGIVGELGPTGIEIDDGFRTLQQFVVDQHDSGVLVCLCSKNNESLVRETFACRPEMPLTWDRIISSRINWTPKSANLVSLADELNLGLDSFVLIDDSAYETAEVRANAPSVLALHFPAEPEAIRQFVRHCWAFDRLAVTDADRRRAASYKENAQRTAALEQAGGFEKFLENLDLVVNIAAPDMNDLSRSSQMTLRTNQFNVTTIRRTETEIRHASADGLDVRNVSVRDRFGDYGVVGLMLYDTRGDALRVDTFLLSCRALGRRVEHRMLAELGRIASEHGQSVIEIPFIRTDRNVVARRFLDSLGVEPEPRGNDEVFVVSTDAALRAPTLIPNTSVAAATNRVDSLAPVATVRTKAAASELMTRIATELSYPAQILDAVVSRRARSRSTSSSAMVEPRTGTERVIADAWKRALRLDRVGVTDDFFALGGTSIDAVALFGNLRRRFNKPLLPTLLFQAATIERLAAEIDGPGVATDKRFTSLTPIQTSGTRPPLFCVHAGAGTILFYNPIAKALGADQPVYAFQSQGLYGGKLPQASIEAMAAHYISEMRAVQPNGPYRLAGFCLGATLAFEMAVQLQRTGEHVEFLGSFDGLAPRHRSGPGRPDSGPRSALQKRLDSGLLKIRNLRNRALLKYTRRFGGPVPRVFRRFAWYFLVNNHLAKVNYHPSSPFLGALHVFTIKGRYAEPRLGWSQWVNGDVQTIEISGEFLSHRDLMDEPMVSLVAAGVNELLAGSPSNDTARAARRQLTTSGAS